MIVSILVYLFTSDIYFRFYPRVGRYEKSKKKKKKLLLSIIIYGIILSTEIKYMLFPKLIYPDNI